MIGKILVLLNQCNYRPFQTVHGVHWCSSDFQTHPPKQRFSGWWFGCDFLNFPILIGFLIIPIDKVIFFRGVAQPPTSFRMKPPSFRGEIHDYAATPSAGCAAGGRGGAEGAALLFCSRKRVFLTKRHDGLPPRNMVFGYPLVFFLNEHNHGKPAFFGVNQLFLAIFNSYVSLPDGIRPGGFTQQRWWFNGKHMV